MRTHPRKRFEILSRAPEFGDAAQIAYCREERFDGSGYPRGLAGDWIPLAARDEIVSMKIKQFDPLAVKDCVAEERTLRQMVALKCTIQQPKGDSP